MKMKNKDPRRDFRAQAKKRLTPEEYLDAIREAGKNVVGTFISAKGGNFIIPDDDRMPQSVEVDAIADRGQTVVAQTVSGLKVVGKFNDKNPSHVNVVEILEKSNGIPVDVMGILRQHNLYQEFSNEVIAEAKKVAKIEPEEITKREDLRGKQIITIDPEDAKDLDDAISLEKNPDGTWELGVHIADVSHYVTEGGELDTEAYKRGTSVYFPGGVLPMLPTQLSNNICSLLPNVDRLTMSCFMKLDPNGKVLKSRICNSVINVETRFAYDEVQKIYNGDADMMKTHKKTLPLLNNMAELTKIIEKNRKNRGEVAFDIPEPKIILDADGQIADVKAYPHELAHRTIETMMILCNECVAETALQHNLPFVYRIHEKPDALKVQRFNDMLKPFGITSKIDYEHPTGRDYQNLLEAISAKPNMNPEQAEQAENRKRIVSQMALRSMQKAKYSDECMGHFGLGSKHYCHFTSPIRRYPDLVIHRNLKALINRQLSSHKIGEMQQFVSAAAEQSTKTEMTATEVEREVDNLKRAQYMHAHIGEVFDGTISGVMDFGVFVYLPNTVEGLVKVENLPHENGEFWNFDDKTMTMTSSIRKNKLKNINPKDAQNARPKTLKMGDKMRVLCAGVNIPRRQIEFSANGILKQIYADKISIEK
jgi:ribonuclease R